MSKRTARDLPVVHIGNEKVVPRTYALEINEKNWRELEREIERIRDLDKTERAK